MITINHSEQSDYLKYRGKCKEYCEQAVKDDSTLKIIRGHYIDGVWPDQQHWWCVRADSTIYDPTALQFPSKGSGIYVEFDGIVECDSCGNEMPEEDAHFEGRFAFCSGDCYYRFVMG